MTLINENLIDLQIEGKSKEDVIKHLAEKIHLEDRLTDLDEYYANVMERENLTSTGIGFGIAIPHGKCEHVKQTTIAFGRVVEEVEWQSLDGAPVKVVFLLAVPEACKGDQHLRIIAGLSRQLIHDEFREKLFNAKNQEEIVDLINNSLSNVIA